MASVPVRPKRQQQPLQEVFVSFDVEADGPSPATNSCIMLGCVVALVQGPSAEAGCDKDLEAGVDRPVDSTYSSASASVSAPTPKEHTGDARDTDAAGAPRFCRPWILEEKEWCIEPQPGRTPDRRCVEDFWAKHPDILAYIEERARPAADVVREFIAWYAHLRRTYNVKAWVAKPASFDHPFLSSLFYEFSPQPRVKGWAELPFSIRCMSSMLTAASMAGIALPDLHDPTLVHTHNALDDARGQAHMYRALCAALQQHRCRGARSSRGLGEFKVESSQVEVYAVDASAEVSPPSSSNTTKTDAVVTGIGAAGAAAP
jgi:hypothetical protein